ncbi:MAG: type II toxin-antitoxin system TacA family antitoxin [Actinomycetota bacterium]
MAKVERLDVRLTPEDDELIRRAASAEGMSVSAFVVSRSRAAAEEVLADRVHFFLDPETWDELHRRLSEPPRHKPGLAKLLAEPDIFE